jgi:hypothetical protein
MSRDHELVIIPSTDGNTDTITASSNNKNIREIIVLLANAGMILFITERMWTTAVEMAEDGELSLHLQLPTAPFVFALSLLAAVSVIVQLYMAWRFVTLDLPQMAKGTD